MTTYKPAKKGPNKQQIVQQLRRQHVDRQLFTLDYLNQTMSYITYNNQALTNYLEIDSNILNRVLGEDVKKFGLNFVQRIKSMKQSCDQNIFVKDLQEYGDFVNYDLPKTYQRDLSLIQSQLRQQIDVEVATKRLKKRFPNIGSRMTSNEINKLNNRHKEEILNSVINNLQMIPERSQNNLERNALYRELFHIEYVMKDQNEEKLIIENIPSQQGISNKIRIAQRPQVKNQYADPNKVKKIAKGSRKNQSSNQQPDEYVPKITKKLKIEQNPLIIPKPVLINPQNVTIKKQRQPNLQSNSLLLGQMAEIDKKSTKYSNNLNIQQINKSMGSQNDAAQLKKQKVSDQQNVISNTVPQQRVKRKYNKAPKQEKGSDLNKSKNSSKTQKEHKQKREYHRRQKKSEEQQSKKQKKKQMLQSKKSELQSNLVENAALTNTLGYNKPAEEVSYVSIAIQTYQKQEKSQKKAEVKQQKNVQQIAFSMNSEKDRYNIFQSIRIQELKQDKNNLHPGHSFNGQGSILGESLSLHHANSSRRQSISVSRQDNALQSSISVSNPIYPENHPHHPQQQKSNEQHNQIEEQREELDISEFLN